MNERELRTRIIEARTEQEVAIRDNKRILDNLVTLIQKLQSFDQNSIYFSDIDLSNINSLDIDRLSHDSAYVNWLQGELTLLINSILRKVEGELGI